MTNTSAPEAPVPAVKVQDDLLHAVHELLEQYGAQISYTDLVTALAEAAPDHEPLTRAEEEFLQQHTGFRADLDHAEQAGLNVEFARHAAQAQRQLQQQCLSTSEVADLLGRAPANVRRSLSSGHLHSVGQGKNREHLFPIWQFTQDGRILPGLKQLLKTFPLDYHPLDIGTYLNSPQEPLGGTTPREWLSAGKPLDSVLALVDELNRI